MPKLVWPTITDIDIKYAPEYPIVIVFALRLTPYDDNVLKERTVFTIEPGLYFNKMTIGFAIPEEYYDLGGIRIEDMYAILKRAGSLQLINLSIDIPKK